MASVNFHLSKLFQAQFGVEGADFVQTQGSLTQEQALSAIGTPVYEIVQVQAEHYSYYDIRQKRKRDDGVIPEYTFPYELLLEVSQAKKIISTEVAARDGSILEYIGLGDYQITLRGFIINYASQDYPDAGVMALKRILDIPQSLKVSSLYLNRLGIDRIAVKDYSLPLMEGHRQVQPFVINAISDLPYELDLIQKKLLK
jgi:hypothetical protein